MNDTPELRASINKLIRALNENPSAFAAALWPVREQIAAIAARMSARTKLASEKANGSL